MKNFVISVFLTGAVLISGTPADARGKKEAKMPNPSKSKTLVVYYSMTGNTEIVAKEIAVELKADLRKVEDLKPYRGKIVFLTGGFAALFNKNGKIKPVDFSVKEYDRIFVGSPVWAGSPVPAVNTFLTTADFTGKDVVPFVTMGGDNPSKSIPKMSSKITGRGGKIIGSFAIKTGGKTPEEISAKAKEEIARFLK